MCVAVVRLLLADSIYGAYCMYVCAAVYMRSICVYVCVSALILCL
jgi:hypothetical protein